MESKKVCRHANGDVSQFKFNYDIFCSEECFDPAPVLM